MNKRKGVLEFIKKYLSDVVRNKEISDRCVTNLMKSLLSDFYKHYELADIEKCGGHKVRFYLLYIDKNDLTFEDMSIATHICLTGFTKWVRFYNETALKYIKEKSKNNPDYGLILNEYQNSGIFKP